MAFVSGIWSQVLNSIDICSSVKDKSISLLSFILLQLKAIRIIQNLTVENLAALMNCRTPEFS